jgi:hypothetical protein
MTTKGSIQNQSPIHDESNTSIGVEEITRRMEISQEQFDSKRAMLLAMARMPKREVAEKSSLFKSIEVKSNPDNLAKLEIALFTADGAGLNVTLTKYGDNVHYFGTRGSPTKLLTGQNLIPVKDNQRVDKIVERLGCTRFEARTVVTFYMIRRLVRELLGKQFFSAEELRQIEACDTGVYSIGFATWLSMGQRRHDYFGLLAYLCEAKISVCGMEFGLLSSFMKTHAQVWRDSPDTKADDSSDEHVNRTEQGGIRIGYPTGVLLQKKKHGVVAYSQMLYLKDAEVAAKSGFPGASGLRNAEMLRKLSAAQQEELGTLVRVDNTFYKGYIRLWLDSLEHITGGKDIKTDHRRLSTRDAAPLFDKPGIIKDMVSAMSIDLGLRTLLGAPTLARIEALIEREDSPLPEGAKELLRRWAQIDSSVDAKAGVGARIVWDLVDWKVGSERRNRATALMLYKDYFLDITLPYDFYRYLNEKREEYFYDEAGRRAIADERIAHTEGSRSKANHAIEARAAAKKLSMVAIRDLKRDLALENLVPRSRSEILLEHV